jgi:hypothetical protein
LWWSNISGANLLVDVASISVRRLPAGSTACCRLTPSAIEEVVRGLVAKGGQRGPLTFTAAKERGDGVTQLSDTRQKVYADSAMVDITREVNDRQWSVRYAFGEGATVEVVDNDGPLALRGLLRVNLRGDDAQCTEQLEVLVETLQLQALLETPAPAAFERERLVGALQQADFPEWESLRQSNPESVSPGHVRLLLENAGYDADRIAGLTLTEVVPGHYVTTDSQQIGPLAEAGARFLYHTMNPGPQMPENTLRVLTTGLKSTVRRMTEGLLQVGWSPTSDLSSGGALGAFTRLATQKAISLEQGYANRGVVLLLRPEILARCDWYGWAQDKYGSVQGRTQNNVGADLVKAIDESDAHMNEQVFSGGIGPQEVMAVVAHSEELRGELIAYLRANDFKPPDGQTLESFVRSDQNLPQVGLNPYDVGDPLAFAQQAIVKAEGGRIEDLDWFLRSEEVPQSFRAQVELQILRGLRTSRSHTSRRGRHFSRT